MDAKVIGLLIFDDGEIGMWRKGEAEEGFDFLEEAFVAPVGHEKLQASFLALVPVAVVAIDGADGFNDWPNLCWFEEAVEGLGEFGCGA